MFTINPSIVNQLSVSNNNKLFYGKLATRTDYTRPEYIKNTLIYKIY